MTANDKTFTKLFRKAQIQGLQLGGYVSWQEGDVAVKVARTIRTFAPQTGQVYLDNLDAQMLLRVGEVLHNAGIRTAILPPGGGFGLWILDLGRLHKELAR